MEFYKFFIMKNDHDEYFARCLGINPKTTFLLPTTISLGFMSENTISEILDNLRNRTIITNAIAFAPFSKRKHGMLRARTLIAKRHKFLKKPKEQSVSDLHYTIDYSGTEPVINIQSMYFSNSQLENYMMQALENVAVSRGIKTITADLDIMYSDNLQKFGFSHDHSTEYVPGKAHMKKQNPTRHEFDTNYKKMFCQLTGRKYVDTDAMNKFSSENQEK